MGEGDGEGWERGRKKVVRGQGVGWEEERRSGARWDNPQARLR